MHFALNLLVDTTLIFSGLWGMSPLLTFRNKLISLRILVIAVLIIIQSQISLLQIPIINLISSILLIFTSSVILFNCKKESIIIYDTLIFICALAADMLATLCFSATTKSTIISVLQEEKLIISRYLLASIFTFTLCCLSFTLIKRKKVTLIWYELCFYVILAIGEAITVYYITMNIFSKSSGNFLILFLIGCFILNIYIVFVFDKISIVRETEKENALLRQQSDIQTNVYQDLQIRYAQSMQIVHDVKKHVSALENLISNEDMIEANQYKDALYKELEKFHISFRHNNRILTVMINNELIKSEQKNVKIELDIEEFDFSFISNVDITVMVANIFDNAFEAVAELDADKRNILFILKKKMNCFIIHAENPFCQVNVSDKKEFLTTKSGHMGIGLKNIENTVNKYGGIFSVNAENGIFTTSVTIPFKD